MGGRCPQAPSSDSSERQLRRPARENPGHRATDVLSARAGLSEVRWALAGAAPRGALRSALQALLEDGAELRACRLRRVQLQAARKPTRHYDRWGRAGGTDVAPP